MRYIYIFLTILFTISGQIIIKWRVTHLKFSLTQVGFMEKGLQVLKLVFDPMILLGLFAAFVASLFWLVAMSKFEITEAYPFMSLSPALIFFVGIWFLGETFTIGKLLGLIIIIIGTIVTVKF